MDINKIDIKSLTLEEMEKFILSINEKKYRALQVYIWLHNKLVNSFEEMTNLSKELRNKLENAAYITKINILENHTSNDGTKKYLFEVENGHTVETVLMKQYYGNSICISTQVGCRMSCSFCASGVNGLERNLTTGEILSQIYEVQKNIGERITHVVVMGMGEPFDNYNNLIKFINIIISPKGLAIGQRHITVSTSGLVDKIYQFSDEKTQVNLAISLHAPNNDIRKSIMNVAKRFTIEELLEACKYYTEKTNRRVTYEYAIIKGVNDSVDNAEELAKRLKRTLSHVNIIPVNNVKENDYVSPSEESIANFTSILKKYGIVTTIRKTLGSDINASCGQLRENYESKIKRRIINV